MISSTFAQVLTHFLRLTKSVTVTLPVKRLLMLKSEPYYHPSGSYEPSLSAILSLDSVKN